MSTMTICLIIFALMVIGFFIKQLPMSFTSMAVLVALVLTGCVTAYFVWDVIVSTRTALNLAKLIEELEKMRRRLDQQN